MNSLDTWKKIVSDTWRLFMYFADRSDPMDVVVNKFVEYEQKWKNTEYWKFAGAECSAKLTALEELAKRRTA